jgi:hypothetical protein
MPPKLEASPEVRAPRRKRGRPPSPAKAATIGLVSLAAFHDSEHSCRESGRWEPGLRRSGCKDTGVSTPDSLPHFGSCERRARVQRAHRLGAVHATWPRYGPARGHRASHGQWQPSKRPWPQTWPPIPNGGRGHTASRPGAAVRVASEGSNPRQPGRGRPGHVWLMAKLGRVGQSYQEACPTCSAPQRSGRSRR